MPVFFFGHGSPMHAIGDDRYARAWSALGVSIPRPRAILAVSAHWYITETAVTAMAAPRTIHDFGGFPAALYNVEYPAPGSPELAARVAQLLHPFEVRADQSWGLDHGTWSVLRHIYPQADVPVVQLSIDLGRPAQFHYELGQRLAPLRDEGVLIVASGNIVHNLYAYQWDAPEAPPYPWAARFEQQVRDALLADTPHPLIAYDTAMGEESAPSVPSPDHYLPLLYAVGARRKSDALSFPVEGFEGGSMSMLTVRFG